MEIKESIKIMKAFREHWDTYSKQPNAHAIDNAIWGLEKQYPQKIILNSEDDREYEDYICPNCKTILQQRRKGATAVTVYHFAYCHTCGQALDWRDING